MYLHHLVASYRGGSSGSTANVVVLHCEEICVLSNRYTCNLMPSCSAFSTIWNDKL